MSKSNKMEGLGEAAKYMRKAADIIDRIVGASDSATSEDEGVKPGKKRRICD